MNTKSVVAKPRATPKTAKAVVKKPKAAPKAAKAAKAAKATVKKPKAVPKAVPRAVPKAAKAQKAVVKKPIRGGVRSNASNTSNTSNRFGASLRAVISATARRIGSTFSRLQRKTPSNAVAPSNVSPTAIEKEERLTKLKNVKTPPAPNILLDKIKDTYISYMEKLLKVGFITAYDLLVLIDTIATDLNAFFEEFLLYYYPKIIFPSDTIYHDLYDKLLTYQSKFVRLIENIRYYIHELGISYKEKPKKGKYFEPSTIVYNGILDGTQSKEWYARRRLNFFTNKLIISKKELDSLKPYITQLQRNNKKFGDLFVIVGGSYINFNDIMIVLNDILQDFFMHIQSMVINEDESVQKDDNIKEYIELVKKTAKENSKLIGWKGYELQSAINLQIHKFKQGNKRVAPDIESRGLYH
jgi:hypothetical protein